MFCKNCGEKVEDKIVFCGKCGSKIENNDITNFSHNNVKVGVFRRLFTGRIGRLNFFLGHLFFMLPIFIVTSLWGLIAILSSTFNLKTDTSFLFSLFDQLVVVLIAISCIIYVILNFFLLIRRCHDVGYTGWLSCLLGIPYAGALVGLFLLFKKGDDGQNKYGMPPIKGRKFINDIFNK
jgi:uncharacterized membrane protein YhaH (DUF805 family)